MFDKKTILAVLGFMLLAAVGLAQMMKASKDDGSHKGLEVVAEQDGTYPSLGRLEVILKAKTAAGVLVDVLVNAAGKIEVEPEPLVFDADAPGNCVAITASSVSKTLPTASDMFTLCANGNAAYVLCGASPTATTTVTTGYSILVPEGACVGPMQITEAACAVIGTSAAGSLCFLNFTQP